MNLKVGELSNRNQWPPVGISPVWHWGVPFANTSLLLASAMTVTVAQKYVQAFNRSYLYTDDYYYFRKGGVRWFLATLFLGSMFLYVQYKEYCYCSFTISDGAYGSTFYLLTGFHGLHVFIGLVFLGVACLRLNIGHFSKRKNRFNVTAAVWYWHFVDVVWVLVWLLLYRESNETFWPSG